MYIQKYRIENNDYMQQVKSILDKNEKDIITACQNYLYECEQGKKNPMTPDIDGIMSWLQKEELHKYQREKGCPKGQPFCGSSIDP